jgi:hypothetical protein
MMAGERRTARLSLLNRTPAAFAPLGHRFAVLASRFATRHPWGEL